MSKLAVTYYHDPIYRNIQDFKIHESGEAAVKYFKENVRKYFHLEPVFQSEPRISEGKSYSCRTGFRSYTVRYLDEDEVKIYGMYGDEAFIDTSTAKLIEPDRVMVSE